MKEEQWDALISTDGSRVWPSGKAPPFQGGLDGFDSRGPLHGFAGLAERRGSGFPSRPHEFESRIPLPGSVSPTGKAPGWRPGTRETACEFESRRFRHWRGGRVRLIATALKAVGRKARAFESRPLRQWPVGEVWSSRCPVTAENTDSSPVQAAMLGCSSDGRAPVSEIGGHWFEASHPSHCRVVQLVGLLPVKQEDGGSNPPSAAAGVVGELERAACPSSRSDAGSRPADATMRDSPSGKAAGLHPAMTGSDSSVAHRKRSNP